MARQALEAGYLRDVPGAAAMLIATDAGGADVDLVGPFLEALRRDLAGEAVYLEGEGESDPAFLRATELDALEAELERRGIDIADDNDAIVAALEDQDGETLEQARVDSGGRGFPASINADVVLQPVDVPTDATAADGAAARAMVEDQNGRYRLASGETVEIGKSAKKLFSGRWPAGRLRLAGAVSAVLEAAVLHHQEPQRSYAVAVARLGDAVVAIRLVLNRDGSGSDKLYVVEGLEVAPLAGSRDKAKATDPGQAGAKPAVGSAPDLNVGDVVAQFNAMAPDAQTLFQSASPVESAAFRRWFGDSKVVDADGAPLVVYHGTRRDFEAFDPESIGDRFLQDDAGFFFTEEATTASRYAESDASLGDDVGDSPMVIPAFLSVQNPLVIDREWLVANGGRDGERVFRSAISFFDGNRAALMRRVREGDHDGVIVREEVAEEFGDLFVAFRPEQIKGAFNRGTFDPDDPRILFQGEAAAPRGSVTFPAGGLERGETLIRLLEGADLSTFIHESGHFFLEATRALASLDARGRCAGSRA